MVLSTSGRLDVWAIKIPYDRFIREVANGTRAAKYVFVDSAPCGLGPNTPYPLRRHYASTEWVCSDKRRS